MKKLILLLALLFLPQMANAACGGASPNLTAATLADLALCITAAVDGDTITLANGSYSLTTGLTISGKGITITSGGSGRIVATSTTNITMATGAQVFTLANFSRKDGAAMTCSDVTGTIRAATLYSGQTNYMDGTVTSCVGATLTMNVTSITGSGTHNVWVISTATTTTITVAAAVTGFAITEDVSHSTTISGIKFYSTTDNAVLVRINHTANGKPVILHDNWFSSTSSSVSEVFVNTRRGLIYNCSFDGAFNQTRNSTPIGVKFSWTTTEGAASWATASTMGSADTNGDLNFYVEDSDFHAFQPNNVTDMDNNTRAVWRHNLFNNAGLASHSQDSSLYGIRHFEIYDNRFVYTRTNISTRDFNITNWLFLRGGTGVWTDNNSDDIISNTWANKTEFRMTLEQLRRNSGCDACYTGAVPASRQIGYGYVDGTGGTNAICEAAGPFPGAGYKGDIEPLYIWNNSGTLAVGLEDYSPDGCGGGPAASGYVRAGTEYFNNGTAKPGWTKFAYPHPLQAGGGGSGCIANVIAPATDFGGQAFAMPTTTALTLSNIGDAQCTITSIALSGNTGDFSIGEDCAATLNVGAFCTITATFRPVLPCQTATGCSVPQGTITVDMAAGTDDTATVDGKSLPASPKQGQGVTRQGRIGG